MNLIGAINYLSKKNNPFVCYRLPNSNEPVLLTNGVFDQPDFPDANLSGFLIVPFDLESNCPPLIYTGAIKTTGWENISYTATYKTIQPQKPAPVYNYPCPDQDQYMHQAEELRKKLLEGELQKVVLSRIQCATLPEQFDKGSFFKKLCLKYPSAFVYIVHIDHNTCWIGASPEILLQVEAGEGSTMSLAGSLPAHLEDSTANWTQKELDENSFVFQFIMQKLQQAGISEIMEMPMETVSAGPVVHLQKILKFQIPAGVSPLKLALNLHPTPAVCGIPPVQAKKSILQTEQHPRNYYSGFLGPICSSGYVYLFVNLRCMHVIGQSAFIFAGGGLMPQSVITHEWEETRTKAETLISVLKEYKNNA